MGRILVIDDDPGYAALLLRQLSSRGHIDNLVAASISEGLEIAEIFQPDIIFLDVNLPDGNGLTAICTLKELPCHPEIIIITAVGDPDGAELAIRSGAWDYITKQGSIPEVLLPLTNALEYRQQKKAATPRALDLGEMIGNSQIMKKCFDFLALAASSDANVLITGESGTGKELCAQAIHRNSARSRHAFVVVDCAALPENLVESILFGHEKGSFTGAETSRNGLLEQADKGTLFLDEVAELPLSTQKAFLRAIQERRFRPVGGDQEVTSDFRLVAATNRDLDQMAKDGLFRQDLLFRLRALSLHLPPLRERDDDSREIAQISVAKICDRHNMDTKGISAEIYSAIACYPWPGNIRELIHAMEHAVLMAQNLHVLYLNHLPTEIRVQTARSLVPPTQPPPRLEPDQFVGLESVAGLPSFQQFQEQAAKAYLKQLMTAALGNIKQASRIAKLSRTHLYTLLKEHGIPKTPQENS